jgi:thiol-disulfide isomerase/thioredoxin
MRSAGQLALTVVALGAAFGTGALAYYQFGHKRDSAPQAAVTASEAMAEAPKPAIPDMLPDFTLKDLQGRPHSIREWAGRPLVINFWATWCGPCREEMPLLERLREERKADGVEVVGIAVDFKADVQAFVAKHPISYPILSGEDDGVQVAAALGVPDLALPFSVFVDHRGRILVLRLGQLHEDQAKVILDALRDLDTGKLELAQAKARVAAGLLAIKPAESPARAGNTA